MKINIRKSAIKDLRSIPKEEKMKIYEKIEELKNFPNVSNLKKLSNFQPAFRLRVGNYRVLFDVVNDTIEIGRIFHRKESYKKKRKKTWE